MTYFTVKREHAQSSLVFVSVLTRNECVKTLQGGVGSCSFLHADTPKSEGSTFVCNIGNPLKQDSAVLEFEFATARVNPKDKHIVFALNVTRHVLL